MIYCNLSVLLAERQIKISKISEDTGISRTTITALALNHWQGVRSDTMNTLCKYLEVSVGDIFHFLPFDIEFLNCDYDDVNKSAWIYFKCSLDTFEGEIGCYAYIDIEDSHIPHGGRYGVILTVDIEEQDVENPEQERENLILETIFTNLPHSVIINLENEIFSALVDEIILETDAQQKYPEDVTLWDGDIRLPTYWKKRRT